MPIKKFLSVKNVGRLVDCSQKGPELNRYNLLFAENGRGKTTLCAVLRSLQTGEPAHIAERKTIGPVTGDASVSIRLTTANATFGKKGWNAAVPEIAIFDATFVARNVHAGEYVDREHRANLLQVILGEAGVALATRVNDLDEAIRAKNSDIGKARKAVQAHLPTGAKLDVFLDLPQDADIDAKIVAKTIERDAAKQAESIKNRPALSVCAAPALPQSLLPTLSKSLADVSASAEARLKEHISKHGMQDRGEAWLSEGLGYLKDDSCPFCGQGTKGLSLVEAYGQYFSDAYKALIVEIEQVRADTQKTLGAAARATLKSALATNEAGIQFWKSFVAVAIDTPDFDKQMAPAATALCDAVLALVDQKASSPLSVVKPQNAYESALATYTAATACLAAYNEVVGLANVKIAEQKEKAKNADAASLEKELTGLGLVKRRHDPKVAPLCTDCMSLIAEKGKLDKEKDAAKQALDQHADKMIGDYEATINALLAGFGAGFSITNSRKTYVGGTPTSAYQILINDQAIDLGDSNTPIGEPSFRTTLSSGDKSTLALAFFLAQLDHDPKKAERLVVFDDPFNSQDRSRRERTAELLRRYGHDCAQLLLFSHDPFFLSLVHSKLPKAERHALQLSRASGNTTTIEEWDVEKETQAGYFKDHAALSSYLLNGAKDLVDIVRKIRPVLEGYLRYRFPHQFPDNEWLGDMIKRVRDSAGLHPMSAALAELESINDYSKKYHHDTNPGKADSEQINDGELQAYAKRTLKIVGGY